MIILYLYFIFLYNSFLIVDLTSILHRALQSTTIFLHYLFIHCKLFYVICLQSESFILSNLSSLSNLFGLIYTLNYMHWRFFLQNLNKSLNKIFKYFLACDSYIPCVWIQFHEHYQLCLGRKGQRTQLNITAIF